MIEGSCDALITTIREGKRRLSGSASTSAGTDTKIGLVDVHQKLIDSVCIPTAAERPAEEVIRTVGETALASSGEDAESLWISAWEQGLASGNCGP